MTSSLLMDAALDVGTKRQGKVRDIFDLGDRLLLVSTDRISAFDWVLPTGIPDKGRVLTQMSLFWFEYLGVPNHFLTISLDGIDLPTEADEEALSGRSMIVRKAKVIPIECVVRGYLSGSGWSEYCRDGSVCGISLPAGMQESERLEQPIFTPATKAETGHDENISFEKMCDAIGTKVAEELRRRSIEIYEQASRYAAERGILIADTKFEWGYDGDRIILIDEVLTPDSSRFWPAHDYEPGRPQASYDKQFVRDWLLESGWDRNSPPPPLPQEIVVKTRDRYLEAFTLLTGRDFPWC